MCASCFVCVIFFIDQAHATTLTSLRIRKRSAGLDRHATPHQIQLSTIAAAELAASPPGYVGDMPTAGSCLYNSMLHPLLSLPVTGLLWYQVCTLPPLFTQVWLSLWSRPHRHPVADDCSGRIKRRGSDWIPVLATGNGCRLACILGQGRRCPRLAIRICPTFRVAARHAGI